MFLYRGVTNELDSLCKGQLIPKGKQSTAIPELGERGVECGAGYELGYSEGNGLRAHQIDSNMKKLSFVSTSKSIEIAKIFATKNGACNGYIYKLDSSLFEQFDVVAEELEFPIYPDEYEVSIRTSENGIIPKGVIVDKFTVNCT